jgi:hypothetical protein
VIQVCSDDIWVKHKETDKKQLLIPGQEVLAWALDIDPQWKDNLVCQDSSTGRLTEEIPGGRKHSGRSNRRPPWAVLTSVPTLPFLAHGHSIMTTALGSSEEHSVSHLWVGVRGKQLKPACDKFPVSYPSSALVLIQELLFLIFSFHSPFHLS